VMSERGFEWHHPALDEAVASALQT
jgi:hypothetical protein